MSLDSRRAAQQLLDQQRIRSSISRAYYAAYSAIAGELAARGIAFAPGRRNPDHAEVPGYVLNNIGSLPRTARFQVNRAIRRLYRARIVADYLPGAGLTRSDAIDALRDASRILLAIGVDDE